MENIITNVLNMQILKTILIAVCSYIIYITVKKIVDKWINKIKIDENGKGKRTTYIKLTTNIIKYIFLVVTILVILQVNGIDVTSMIAGLGIVGLISGLALQDALKDIIMGVNIITDNFFIVGDVVKYNEIEGRVISLGLKVTKIQDIYTNNIISITNRNIDKIINVSDWLDIDVPISYNEQIEDIDKIFYELENEIKKINNVKKCDYLGLNSFEESSVEYKIRIYCLPEYKLIIKREALRRIKSLLDKNCIKIPFNQIDIHSV